MMKNKPAARIVAVLLASAALAAHAADLLDDVKARGTLRIGMEGTYPPFNYKNDKGELDGFDVDIAKALAAKLAVRPEFTTTEWSGILAGLQAGKYDVIVNQVAATDKRRETFDFSEPYVISYPQLIIRTNETRKLDTPADLKGKKIGVGQGSNYADLAKSIEGAGGTHLPGGAGVPAGLGHRSHRRRHQRQPADPVPAREDEAAGEGRCADWQAREQRDSIPQGQSEVQAGHRQGPGRHEGRRDLCEDFDSVVRT
jgi:hypothetical protein